LSDFKTTLFETLSNDISILGDNKDSKHFRKEYSLIAKRIASAKKLLCADPKDTTDLEVLEKKLQGLKLS
jgi:hypothetical protein